MTIPPERKGVAAMTESAWVSFEDIHQLLGPPHWQLSGPLGLSRQPLPNPCRRG